MSDHIEKSREAVAIFAEQGGLELEPPTTAKAEDFIRAAGDQSRYISTGLGVAHGADEGSPRHWLYVVPHPNYVHSAYAVEFGLSNQDYTGRPHAEARFDHELSIDETLKLNKDTPAVSKLFPSIGGLLVESVRKRGDLFVAGLEVRYKDIEDKEAVQWSQLVYSRGLLGTQESLKQATHALSKKPGWVKESLKIRNREILAENMALSALCAIRGYI
jgi:hypothetical protein